MMKPSFGNAIAEIGVVNKNKPGSYLIRRADYVFGPAGLQNVTDYPTQIGANNVPLNGTHYAGIVNLPTTYATLLIRWLVLQNTTADLEIIRRYQNASSLTPINRTVSIAPSPAGNLSSLAPNGSLLGINTPDKLLNFTSKFVLYNQPELYSQRQRVAGILGAAECLRWPIRPASWCEHILGSGNCQRFDRCRCQQCDAYPRSG